MIYMLHYCAPSSGWITHEASMSKLSIYIHWPFCEKKCPYCDFNSHVRAQVDYQRWCEAYIQELQYYHQLLPDRIISSIFFGGGTPSLMPPWLVAKILETVTNLWSMDSGAEITLEANPNSVEIANFSALRSAGINRISIGVQALNSADLKFLGRLHDVEHAKAAIKSAAQIFDNYSFDLIYARPSQTIDQWRLELTEALEYALGHLSLYQLTIEPNTAFYQQHQKGEWQIPSADLAGAMYEATEEIMQSHGFYSYEVSNYARPGYECRHNLTYWRYDDFIGIGPGAHGRVSNLYSSQQKIYSTRNHKAPEIWLELVSKKRNGLSAEQPLQKEEAIAEHILMNLRLSEGISLRSFAEKHDCELLAILNQNKLEQLQESGFIKMSSESLSATPAGRQRLDSIIKYLEILT